MRWQSAAVTPLLGETLGWDADKRRFTGLKSDPKNPQNPENLRPHLNPPPEKQLHRQPRATVDRVEAERELNPHIHLLGRLFSGDISLRFPPSEGA